MDGVIVPEVGKEYMYLGQFVEVTEVNYYKESHNGGPFVTTKNPQVFFRTRFAEYGECEASDLYEKPQRKTSNA